MSTARFASLFVVSTYSTCSNDPTGLVTPSVPFCFLPAPADYLYWLMPILFDSRNEHACSVSTLPA